MRRYDRSALGRLALVVCALTALAVWPLRAHAQTVVQTVTVGTNPGPVVLNPATNRIYVASFIDAAVKVIDGSTGAVVATVSVASPGALAVNPVTNKIYVADTNAGNVTVIDGVTNTAGTSIAVGTSPLGLAVNPATNMIYVANSGSSNASIIDGSTNTVVLTLATGAGPTAVAVNPATNKIYVLNFATVSVIDGSTSPQSIIASPAVGSNPTALALNPATNLIYVANTSGNSVSVINGTTNTVSSTITVGTSPRAVAVNPVTNKIYTVNHNNSTVSVIDGAINTTASRTSVDLGCQPSGLALNPTTNQVYAACTNTSAVKVISGATGTGGTFAAATVAATVTVAANPISIAVDPLTNQIYAVSSNTPNLSIINGITDLPATVSAGTSPKGVAVNPATDKIYVANQGSDSVTVIDGSTDTTTTVPVGHSPIAVAVNPVTNQIYVANQNGSSVTVIDGAANTTSTVPVGISPFAIAVNPVTNKIYTANLSSGNVTVIDGVTNTTTSVAAGAGPIGIAVNPVTNKIYVANDFGATVTVIDGATNTATTVGAGTRPTFVAVNPVTNKIYVGNNGSSNATVIDGATNTTATVSTGSLVSGVAVNPVTNKIYVASNLNNNVTVIDGATNTTITVAAGTGPNGVAVNPVTNQIYVANDGGNNVTVIDGASNTVVSTVAAGANPYRIAVNLVTNRIYVSNIGGATVTVLTEEQVQAVPLTNTITPIPGGVTNLAAPTFTFTAASTFIPAAPAVENVYYQLDTWEGPWIAATPGGGNYSGTSPTLQLGTHVVYAYATDGQDANSAGLEQQLIGQMSAEVFTYMLPATATALAADNNPAAVGQAVTFTADVSSVSFPGTPTGTVTFMDGAIVLGPAALTAAVATLTTSSLAVGSHSITAVYSGDTSFSGSTSVVLTEVIANPNPVPTLTSLSPASATAGGLAFTLTANGSNFVNGSVVKWNGTARTTSFVSATQLTASVLVSDISTAGTASVTVFNPVPSGGTSNALTFAINVNPTPTLGSVSPTSATAGGPAFTLTLTGTSFVGGAVVQWNGVALTTTFVSATQLTAAVPATDLQTAGSVSVTVFNPTPGGGSSTAITFTISAANPTARLGSVSPTSATAGGPAFTLTLTGTSFVSGAVVQWNGVALTTTFASATQLTAAVPATDLQTAGSASVTVFNPTPGGGSSTAITFTISAGNPTPTLGSLSTTTVAAQGAAFTLTLTGSSFVASSVVQWNGVALATTFVSATQLTAVIPATDIQTPGSASITIFNAAPGGGTSRALTLNILDFTATSNTGPQTTTAGQSAVFVIATAPVGGAFPGKVTFTATGLPAGAVATFNPASLNAGSNTTMTVTTTPRTVTASAPKPFGPGGPRFPKSFPEWPVVFVLGALLAGLRFVDPNKRLRTRLVPLAALFLLLVTIGYLAGCAGAGFPRLPVTSGTPAGSYTITVDGVSGADSHSTTVMLTVQ